MSEYSSLKARSIYNKIDTIAEMREESQSNTEEWYAYNRLIELYIKQLQSLFIYQNLTHTEIVLGREKGKLDAVKEFKTRTNCSLLEAKRNVEQFFQVHGYTFKTFS